MAPKRSKPLEDPPTAPSSEEEEETSSGEEEEDGEEEEGSSSSEETQAQPQKQSSPPPPPPPPPTQTAKPAPKKPNSTTQQAESESESGSDDDSDSEDDQPNNDATVKPIASKPMEGTPPKTTKPRSKPSASIQAAAKSTATAKRGSETDRDLKDSKRAKKKDSEPDGVAEKSEDTKKQLFQRLWSEEDEIAVLKGIIDFTEKKGYDPSKDMSSFLDFIKKSLHFDVSLSQLKDKVWRLKKKFENHVSKGKKGEDKTFSKAHNQTSFDLSKKIWGSEGTSGVESSAKSNGKTRKGGSNNINQRGKSLAALKAELGVDVDKEAEKVDKMEVEMESHSGLKQITKFDKSVSAAGMEEYVVKRGLEMLEGAKKAEMEEKWKKLHVAELELFLRRNELIREQANLMLSTYKTE